MKTKKENWINKIYGIDVFKFLNEVENNSVDLIIADPPYNLIKINWDTFKNNDEFVEFTKKWISEAILKLKENGSIYIFNSPKNILWIGSFLLEKKLIFKNLIIWHKKDCFSYATKSFVNNQENILFFSKNIKNIFNKDDVRVSYESTERMKHAQKKGILKNNKRWFPNKNGKLCTDIWNLKSHHHINKINGKLVKNIHPTQKPEKLIERIILASSNKGDLILDLFSGSGTTAFIAQKNNRNFLGCESNLTYLDIIKKRLKND